MARTLSRDGARDRARRLPNHTRRATAKAWRPLLERLEDRTVLSSAIPLSASSWTALGPAALSGNSGRITAIAGDPSNANILYIGAAGGGVWKTTNGGSTWTPLTDGQATLVTGALAVSPSNPNTIYAGTGEANYGPSKQAISRANIYYGEGVLKSTDGGASWVLEGNSIFHRRTISRIVVNPTNPNIVYVAVGAQAVNGLPGNTGIWESTDGGNTWTDPTAGISTTAAFSDLAMDPSNSQTLYTAVGDPYGSDPANGLYKSLDGGNTWARAGNFPTGSDANVGRIAIAVSPTSPQTLYASIAQSGANSALYKMMKSVDGGATWSQLTNTPNYMGQYGDYNDSLAVDPASANTVYAGGQTSLLRTTNGGSSWSDIGSLSGGPHVDHHAIAFDASGRYLNGSDGGIWRFNQSTSTWTDLNGNLNTIQFEGISLDPTTANVAFGGAQDNGTDRFNNNLVWGAVDGGDGGHVHVTPTNHLVVYHDSSVASFGAGSFFQKSTNGGSSWFTETNGLNAGVEPTIYYPPFILDPTNASRLLLGTSRVYESTDAANSWHPISTPGSQGWSVGTAISAIAVAPSSPNTIYATTRGHIFVTSNDGATWAQVDIPNFVDDIGGLTVDPANSLIAYAARDRFTGAAGGHVFKTTDGGAHWTDISSNLPDTPANAVVLDPRTGSLYVGTDIGAYGSSNGGTNWSAIAPGLPNARITEMELNTTLNILAVGTYGRGMWQLTSARFAVSPSANPVTAGTPFSLTVTATDPLGATNKLYQGTVTFSSTDAGAGVSLPANYTFTAQDQGVHTFAGVTLVTPGPQTITAKDTANGTVLGTAAVTVNQTTSGATHFAVAAPSPVTAGSPFTITVTALDASNQVATTYLGTVHFTATDTRTGVALPADYTFTAQDAGVHTFTSTVTLVTAGSQTVTATDTANGTIKGQATVNVVPGSAQTLAVSAPPSTPPGSPFTVTVTAFDGFQNVATGYLGTVNFTTTDTGSGVVVPAPYTFGAADAGVHTFTNGFTLMTPGSQTITARDANNTAITGQATVNVTPKVTHLSVSAPASTTAGNSFSVTVTALDANNQVVPSYTGTVHFTSTDPQAVLPANYTFVAADNGVHTFTVVVLKKSGSRTITATDTLTATITGKANVVVSAAAATQFNVNAKSPETAGVPFTLTLYAFDPYGNVDPTYRGTAHFTSTDGQASLPTDYTFTATDKGVHTFTSGVTLRTAGLRYITAADTVTASITGKRGINVIPGPAKFLFVTGFPSPIVHGTPGKFTVTLKDAYGNVATGYTGTVTITSTDPAANLPSPNPYTFTATDKGVHTFTATLNTPGTWSITVTDSANNLSGSQSNIQVTMAAPDDTSGNGDDDDHPRPRGKDGDDTVEVAMAQGDLRSRSDAVDAFFRDTTKPAAGAGDEAGLAVAAAALGLGWWRLPREDKRRGLIVR